MSPHSMALSVLVLLFLYVENEAKFSVRPQSTFASADYNSTSVPDQLGNSIWLFHQTASYNQLAYASYYKGINWQSDVNLPGTGPVYLSPAAVIFHNEVFAFFRDGYGGLWVTSTLNWGVQTNLAPTGTVYGFVVGVVFDDTLYIFYLISGQTQYQYLTTTDGIDWSTTAQVVPALVGGCSFSSQPAAVADSSFNNVLWLWYADPTGLLNYITFDGSQWGIWTALSSSTVQGVQSTVTAVNYQGSVYLYMKLASSNICFVQQTSATVFLPVACTTISPGNGISAVTYVATGVPNPGIYIFWQCGTGNIQYCYTLCASCSSTSAYSAVTVVPGSVSGNWMPSPVVF